MFNSALSFLCNITATTVEFEHIIPRSAGKETVGVFWLSKGDRSKLAYPLHSLPNPLLTKSAAIF